MGHRGKHIIDPETGLCVLCDKDAIQEVTQGRRPGKQYYYPDPNDGSTHRSYNDEAPYGKDRYVYEVRDEPKPVYARKTVYPAPTVRPRRVVYEQPIEEPIVVRRKLVRREYTPPDEVILQRPPPPRPTSFYYADDENQMVPQNRLPPGEPPRRYVVRKKQPQQPLRTVHVVRPPPQTPTPPPQIRTVQVRRPPPQTPPPPPAEPWHSGPRRQVNSDTEIVDREHRIQHDDMHSSPVSSFKPEMYHIKSASDHFRQSPLESPVYQSRTPTPKPVYQSPPPPAKPVYQETKNRKPNKIEPLHRQKPPPPEPTVVKRVYKKLPPGKREPSEDEYIHDENQPHPPPKHYQSSPTHTNGNNRIPEQGKNPTVFYIRNTDEYE